MSFLRYPEYKDSGVGWLGEVPAHWSTTKVKRLASRISSGKTPLGGSETYVDEGVMFLRSQNVYDDGLRLDDVVFISESTDESMAVSRVIPRDILLNITGASIGRSCIVPQDFPPANVNQHVCAIRLRDESQSQLAAWLFKSALVKNQIDLAQNGAAREGLNFEQIGGMIVAIPPLAEQTAIATFLDRETAKIDALVAEQQKLIALLQEKRQAVISHAVTQGLDPNVTMKNSGVEWLGEVPGHWSQARAKNIFAIGRGRVISLEEAAETGSYPVYSSQTLNDGCLGYLETYDFDCVQLTWTTDGANAGTVFLRSGKHNCTNVCGTLQVKNESDLNVEYGLHYLTYATQFYKRPDTNGAKIMNGEMAEVYFLKPPICEQVQIADFVRIKASEFDGLAEEAKSAITLLQERRTALISAAVTGQIDVRGLAGGTNAPDSVAASAYAVSA